MLHSYFTTTNSTNWESMYMKLNSRLTNAIRFLSMDAVQQANSGHPGMPMGMADIAAVLWGKYLKHNPENPSWINRDRFILSNGHGSMLLYSLLHLTGYDLSIDDLKQFRQLDSKTPGHPEYGYSPGVDTTTGPLGQGLANAVGMALAEKLLSNTYNKPGYQIIDHYTYVFLGDGCLMEGISHEVSSLAGTLKLGKLIAFWDDNNISIDGNTQGWFTEDVAKRYESYGWQVIANIDGHDFTAIEAAIIQAQQEKSRPTLVCCKTKIGQGSPNKAGSHSIHGSPLGHEEIAETRKVLNWNYSPFEIPQDVYDSWCSIKQGIQIEKSWNQMFDAYEKSYPLEFCELNSRLKKEIPQTFKICMDDYIKELLKNQPNVATRKASQMSLEKICKVLPEMFGGSSDLTGSNLTNWSGSKWVNNHEIHANYLSYGVREFGMAAMMNGMSLYGGFRVYGGTFLVFSDYARNAIRMSAIMKQAVIYVMTHDSIGLGEDGPTHQPIEHLPSLRLIPNLYVWRPADAIETAVAWQSSLEEKYAPSLLALSRQNLPALVKESSQIQLIKKGGYLIKESKKADITLIATGSEMSIVCDAKNLLSKEGISANIVSMPCVEKFMQQDNIYQKTVIRDDIPALIVEAAQGDLWHCMLPKAGGDVIGLNHFGESAPAEKLYEKFGLTAHNVLTKVKNILSQNVVV